MIKSIVMFFLVLFCIRLTGKRQLGEMQPFELVIMLIIADVACNPINDPYVPFYGGIVPVLTLTFLSIMLSLLARKSLRARRFISGKSVIVIDKNGINYENLKKMNLNMTDLLEAIHGESKTDINDIEYAIFETNGKICIVDKMPQEGKNAPVYFPLTLVIDGQFDMKNMQKAGLKPNVIENSIRKNGIKNIKDVLFVDVRQDGTLYVAPKHASYYTDTLRIKGSW
jgi:uncharacterized membrane protein YcaP (DUF421 family)